MGFGDALSSRPHSAGFLPDSAERYAEQAFDARSVELCVAVQLGEHGTHLALAKAEVAQGGEDLGVCVGAPWVYWVAVSGAVRMAEAQSAVGLVVNEQLAAMGGSVMASAERQKVGGLVATTFCAWLNMMHVDERRVGAAWGAATASIALEHGATQSWRDALLGARARTDIGRVHVGAPRALMGRGAFVAVSVGSGLSTLLRVSVRDGVLVGGLRRGDER